jgi:hypothetical protein
MLVVRSVGVASIRLWPLLSVCPSVMHEMTWRIFRLPQRRQRQGQKHRACRGQTTHVEEEEGRT